MTTEQKRTPLKMSRSNLRRRKLVNRLMELAATFAAVAAVGILVILVFSVARRGIGALNWDLLTKTPSSAGFLESRNTGLANAIVGSIVIVGLATAMALPAGILIALYLTEYAKPRVRNFFSFVLDVLAGIPAIVIGIFVFGLLVVGHAQSGYAAAFALACLMLPFASRAVQEVLLLVPNSTREASHALGVPKWRTTISVVLPQTIGGIITGATLAVARVAGETAPLLFTSSLLTSNDVSFDPSHALFTIPLAIFEYSESPDPHDHELAWSIALVLILFILFANLGARALATRSRRRMTGR
jgi:phosphate transport system permease protein